MIPQRFTEANTVRLAPPDMENCSDLHLYADAQQCISAWRPTPEELVRINLGEPVWLWVIMGGAMPPVALSVGSPFEQPKQEEEP